MPMMRAFERETLDLSRAALQLEKLTACSDSIPTPAHYQQILKRLSELHCMWREHRINQRMRILTLGMPGFNDEPGFEIEQQLKAVSTSIWPRSAQAGLLSIRVAVPGILQSMDQHVARERALCATLVHRRKTSPMERTIMVRSEAALKVKQATA